MQSTIPDDDDEYEWVPETDPAVLKQYMGVKGVQAAAKYADQGAGGSTDDPFTTTTGLTKDQLKGWTKARASMSTLERLKSLRSLYKNEMGDSGPAGLKEYLPGSVRPANGQFDAKVNSLLFPAKSASKDAGDGAFTEGDMLVLKESLPNRWKSDSFNETAMAELDANLRGHIKTGFGAAGLSQADIERAVSMTPTDPYTDADGSLNKQAVFDKMVADGRPTEDLMAFLKETGTDPAAVDANRDAIEADRNYRHANPNGPKGAPAVLPNAPPSATATPRPDAAAIKAKYGIQ